MAILILLLSISWINFDKVGQDQTLTLVAEQLVNEIRTAQNSALAGQQMVFVSGASPINGYSYGVYIDTVNKRYIRFADAPTNSDGLGSCGRGISYGTLNCPTPSGIYLSVVDKDMETISLPKHITFVSASGINIVFRLPKRSAFVNGDSATSATIILKNDLNHCRSVTVSPVSGQVSSNSMSSCP